MDECEVKAKRTRSSIRGDKALFASTISLKEDPETVTQACIVPSDNESGSSERFGQTNQLSQNVMVDNLSSDSPSCVVVKRRQGRPPKKGTDVYVKRAVTVSSSEQPDPYLLAVLQHCPLPDCDSGGHLNGRDPVHITLSGCPRFHNLTAEECRALYKREERSRLERQTTLATLPPIKRGLRRPRVPKTCASVTKEEEDSSKSSCETRHAIKEEILDAECEPSLQGLASAYDVMLFRKSQQKVVASVDGEIREHYKLLPHKEYRIKNVIFGDVQLKTWYKSPYSSDLACMSTIYVCEFCLHSSACPVTWRRHAAKCLCRHPPGTEIYRNSYNLSFFEVDGKQFKRYCQNLCLLGKLFLDHKTLFQDVEPFLFYVLTKADSKGCHILGYFSKEKQSLMNYNLSCILTLPHHMRKGYGKMLIEFSYLLSREEQKIGSPERPLSDLGLMSYRNYWTEWLVNYLANYNGSEICIRDMSQESCIHVNDIVSTLQFMGLLKYWKGQYYIFKNDDVIFDHLARYTARPQDASTLIDPTCLRWSPPEQPSRFPRAATGFAEH